MNKTESIAAILRMPRDFRSGRNVTFGVLLKEAGYIELHKEISVNDIRESLARNPEYIEDWVIWSDDQRSHPAWFLRIDEDPCPYIGYVDLNAKNIISERHEFADPGDACAHFIKLELEKYRDGRPQKFRRQ